MFSVIQPREIPATARRFIALDRDGGPFRGVEIDGRRFDEIGWVYSDDSEMPADFKERPV